MTQSAFDIRKNEILNEKSDKSLKKSIDLLAVPIVDLLNRSNQYVTTSSCSGRIIIIEESKKSEKKGGNWIFVSHDKLEANQVEQLLNHKFKQCDVCCGLENASNGTLKIILKFEAFVLHAEARNIEFGKKLLGAALQAGFRNSGMVISERERVMVAIRHTMKIDTPIGEICEHGKHNLFVSKDYLSWLLKTSNDKFIENEERIRVLKGEIMKKLEPKKVSETFAEKKERKRREGLERQRLLKLSEERDMSYCKE